MSGGERVLEQPNQIKCHLCGDAAEFAFAYARFSDREAFFGVIYRGVCRKCLGLYIENIKNDRHLRGELLLWPVVFLPFGALLAALSGNTVSRTIGYFLLSLAVVIPLVMRFFQWREARRARRASDAENISRFSERMCREDALHTSRQTKLIYLRPEYADAAFEPARIARETGVTRETAVLIQRLSVEAQKILLRVNGRAFVAFDKAGVL